MLTGVAVVRRATSNRLHTPIAVDRRLVAARPAIYLLRSRQSGAQPPSFHLRGGLILHRQRPITVLALPTMACGGSGATSVSCPRPSVGLTGAEVYGVLPPNASGGPSGCIFDSAAGDAVGCLFHPLENGEYISSFEAWSATGKVVDTTIYTGWLEAFAPAGSRRPPWRRPTGGRARPVHASSSVPEPTLLTSGRRACRRPSHAAAGRPPRAARARPIRSPSPQGLTRQPTAKAGGHADHLEPARAAAKCWSGRRR